MVKRLGQHPGDPFPRDVVRGRAEAAGGNYEVRPAKRDLYRLANRLRRIRHRLLSCQDVAGIGQGLAQPLLVGVEDAAKQQLRAGIDEFDLHSRAANIRATGAQGKLGQALGQAED